MADSQNDDEEDAVTNFDLKRAVLPTEKGLEKLHQYINARRAKLRLLTAKYNQIERLLGSDDNLTHIEQKEMKHYKKLYEEFIKLNESVKLHLKEEDHEANQTCWFEPKVSNCQNFMNKTENWIEETKLHTELVDTCGQCLKCVCKTKIWQVFWSFQQCEPVRIVCYFSTSSKEGAALVAKAAALKATQALALKEAQLTADKEQLETETELAASNARIKVYAEYESPQQQVGITTMSNAIMQDDDEGQTKTGTSPSKLKYQKTTNSLGAKPKVQVDWRPNCTCCRAVAAG